MTHPEAGAQGGRPFSAAEPRSAGTRTQLASLKPRESNPEIKSRAADPIVPVPNR